MYRVGVIGCRGIGNRHAQGAESLKNAEVVAGCDLVPEQRDEFAAQFKATNPGLEMYDDYREMLEKAQLDIVTVATGDNRHADLVVAAAEAGAKGIFCEKNRWPPASKTPTAWWLPQKATTPCCRLTTLATGCPSGIACHELVTAGRDWRRESGLVRALRHALNVVPQRHSPARRHHVVRWQQPSVARRRARGRVRRLQRVSRRRRARPPATEPSANAYIHFANGVRGVYLGEKQAPNRLDFTISGTTGKHFHRAGRRCVHRARRRARVG